MPFERTVKYIKIPLKGPIGTLGLQLSGIVCSLSDNFELHGFPETPRDSWALAVRYCVFFMSVNFRPQGFPGSPRDS